MRPARLALLVAMLTLGLATTTGSSRGQEVPSEAATLEEVSVVADGDRVVVRVQTSRPRRYRHGLIETPWRLVLDFEDTTYAWRKTPLAAGVGPVVRIRGGQYRKDVARVVLELSSRVTYGVREEGDSLLVVLGAIPEVATPSASAPPVDAVATARVPAEREPGDVSGSTVAQAEPTARPAAPTTAPPMAPASAQPVPEPPTAAPVAAPVAQPAPPPPTAPPVARDGMISLEFKDAEVVNLLRILAAESGRNLVIGDDVKGRMSISLRNVPWTLALQIILEARGLERVDRDGVIRIVSVEQLTKEREARARMEEAKAKAEIEIRTKRAEAEAREFDVQQRKRAAEAAAADARARGPLVEEAIQLTYADPADVANTLQGLLGLGPTAVDIPRCRDVKQKVGEREVTFGRGGGISGPIAEPPFSQLFGPPREEPGVKEPPRPVEDVTGRKQAVRVYCPTNTLFVRLYAADLERVRRLIRESLDVPVPQIKIEARMEILERDDLFALGIRWGTGVVTQDSGNNVIVGSGFTSDPTNLGFRGNFVPLSAQPGLPLGGNLINLPIGALLQGAASAGAGGFAFGILGDKFNLNLALEALRAQGKTLTLARPDVVTLENNLAHISLGEEIPYATVSSAGTQVQFRAALLQLSVIPTLARESPRNRVKMSLIVENNSRGATVNLGSSGSPPAINRRRAETDVIVREGDHLVIGGITTAVLREDVRKVPLFGDVPLLGWLFKQRGTQENRRELVIFITPSVLKGDGSAAPTAPRAR